MLGQDFMAHTLERSWQLNKPNVSCIPTGVYLCKHDTEGKHKYFVIRDVPERSNIEIHPANIFTELAGCIALGTGITLINNNDSLIDSKPACESLKRFINNDEFFILHIKNIKDL